MSADDITLEQINRWFRNFHRRKRRAWKKALEAAAMRPAVIWECAPPLACGRGPTLFQVVFGRDIDVFEPMSWSLNLIGSPAAVKAALEKNLQLSPALKAAIAEICDDTGWDGKPSTAIRVSGSGHCGSGSSISRLEVERVVMAPEPVDAKSPEAPQAMASG